MQKSSPFWTCSEKTQFLYHLGSFFVVILYHKNYPKKCLYKKDTIFIKKCGKVPKFSNRIFPKNGNLSKITQLIKNIPRIFSKIPNFSEFFWKTYHEADHGHILGRHFRLALSGYYPSEFQKPQNSLHFYSNNL